MISGSAFALGAAPALAWVVVGWLERKSRGVRGRRRGLDVALGGLLAPLHGGLHCRAEQRPQRLKAIPRPAGAHEGGAVTCYLL